MESARPRPDVARRPRSGSLPSSTACAGSPTTCGGRWHPGARALFSRLDGGRLGALPQPDPVARGRRSAGRGAREPGPPGRVPVDHRASSTRYLANGSNHWFHRQYASALAGPDRLLLRRVRVPRVARDLLGRSRRPGRRPPEVGQRHGPPVRRRRAALPEGLLPPDDRRRRPPGARLPRLRPQPPAAAPGGRPRRRRPAGHGRRCPAAT